MKVIPRMLIEIIKYYLVSGMICCMIPKVDATWCNNFGISYAAVTSPFVLTRQFFVVSVTWFPNIPKCC